MVWGLSAQFVLAIGLMRWDGGWKAAQFLYREWYKFREDGFAGAGELFGDPYFVFHPFIFMVIFLQKTI